jgi:hypothetical protein
MELQRATLLMYASCGWFFDDIAGLESSLVIRLSAHALDLFRLAGGHSPASGPYARVVAKVLGVLGEARSNQPKGGTGADVFRRVAGDRATATRGIAHVAIGRLIETQDPTRSAPLARAAPTPAAPATPGFSVRILRSRPALSLAGAVLTGRARAVQQRTGLGEEHDFWATIKRSKRRRQGVVFECRVGSEIYTLDDLGADARDGLVMAALPMLLAEPRDLNVMRAALEAARLAGAGTSAGASGGAASTPGGLGDGLDERARRRIFAAMLIELLSGERGGLGADALALAVELLDAADVPADSLERRIIEELVWEHLDAGAPRADLARLASRLGFSADAVEPGVAAS